MELTPEEREQAILGKKLHRQFYKKIAAEVGCEYREIGREEVAFAQQALISLNLQKSIEGFTELVHKETTPVDKDERKMQVDAYKEIMRASGVLPSQAGTSIYITNLTQVNTFQNPLIQKVLESHREALLAYKPEGYVEAEVVENEQEDNEGV